MADERFAARPTSYRDTFPWTDLFRTFRVAVDPRKLLLAAAGIAVMAGGWWLISVLCYGAWSKPEKDKREALPAPRDIQGKKGLTEAQANEEYERLRLERDQEFDESVDRWAQFNYLAGSVPEPLEDVNRPPRTVWGWRLRTHPKYEDRGPNPYRLVTAAEKPWQKGDFFGWFLKDELPVLIEPLVKFFEPIIYLLRPQTGTFTR